MPAKGAAWTCSESMAEGKAGFWVHADLSSMSSVWFSAFDRKSDESLATYRGHNTASALSQE
ncbi:hypothetical protein RvY_13000 [Ramazzottius varieornatus]|uniref:Uncharacterized protein n=1 Tax=Ramazzottius varieornatus TaxID=947166 RepID=A0A1D1VQG6_RAMVA|nr:hypothetical protein RvY_13000 [Ramazzottius varieornatus]